MAAGPGLPLAPPSEKILNCFGTLIPSLLLFFQVPLSWQDVDIYNYVRLFKASFSVEKIQLLFVLSGSYLGAM
jgi:hypothetical protein